MRERLPDTRYGFTTKLSLYDSLDSGEVDKVNVYITCNAYDDGRPAEIFLIINNADARMVGFSGSWAIATSLDLQSEVPFSKVFEKFFNQNFPPQGATNNPDIPMCKSIPDFVVKWIQKQFPDRSSEVICQASDSIIASEELARDLHLSKPISEET